MSDTSKEEGDFHEDGELTMARLGYDGLRRAIQRRFVTKARFVHQKRNLDRAAQKYHKYKTKYQSYAGELEAQLL